MDALTLSRIASELQILRGGKINKIAQPEKDEIVLSVFRGKNFNLLISANAAANRVHLTQKPFDNPKIAYNFCMLLRKHLQNGEILSVTQMDFERVLDFLIEGKNELGYATRTHLVAEFTGKTANVILTDEDYVIFDTLKHLPQDLSCSRVTLSGAKYTFFTPQDKIAPNDLDKVSSLLSSPLPARDLLENNLLGVNKKTITEIVYQTDDLSPLLRKAKVIENLKRVLDETTSGKANVVYKNGEISDVFAFDYRSCRGEKVFYDTLCEAEDDFYFVFDKQSRFNGKAKSVSTTIKNAVMRTAKKIAIQSDALTQAEDFDKTKKWGDLILANIYKIKQGQTSVKVVDFYSDEPTEIEIPLDARYSPQKNAQVYYKKYQKQKSTAAHNKVLLAENKELYEYLTTIKSNLDFCRDQSDLDDICREIEPLGLFKPDGKKKTQAPSKPLEFSVLGFTLLVGKNNLQNDALTKSASPSDVWLHTHSVHSSHCVIKIGETPVPDDVLVIAAEICAFYSQARQSGKVTVDYTEKRNVKKPSKSKPGAATYTTYASLVVQPVAHDDLLQKR